jgi:hypothetical protein
MNDVKQEIEKMSPAEYRSQKNHNIEQILKKHQAWDAGLSVQANLELLDVLAFSLADFYQEYRGRLFFAEDILRKQYEELDILERTQAKKNLIKRNLFMQKDGGRVHEKTRFEKMAEDMGLYFQPEKVVQESKENGDDVEQDLFVLKEFLRENGIEEQYLNQLKTFSEAQQTIETNEDTRYAEKQSQFGMDIFYC